MHENNHTIEKLNKFPYEAPLEGVKTKTRLLIITYVGLALILLFILKVRIAPPDLAFYYSFCSSIACDMDFCFANDFENFSFAFHETYLTNMGVPANDWPMGTGVVWLPFFALARFIGLLCSVTGLATASHGFEWLDMWIVTLGATLLYGGGTLWLSYKFCITEGISRNAALWSSWLITLGSSYSYHLFVNSADSHPPSAFFIILFLYLWRQYGQKARLGNTIIIGFSIGVAGLIRPHNLLFLIVPLLDRMIINSKSRNYSLFIKQYVVIVFSAFMTFFPQMIVWKTLYGSWLAIPRSGDVLWTQPELYNTLFSDFHGMISWSPLFAFGLIGLCLKKKNIPLLIPILMQIYIYSCNLAWWCGGSFGNRRMVCCTPLFILGLAIVFEKIPKKWFKFLTIICGIWTLLLLVAEVGGAIQLNHYQRWPEIINAIQIGFLPGLTGFIKNVSWNEHFSARIIGFSSVMLFLTVLIVLFLRCKQKRRYPIIAACVCITSLNILSIVAALRTAPAARQADLSEYQTHDRFTWVVYYEKGFYLLGNHNYETGLEAMLTAAVIEPRHPEPWMYAAMVCEDVYGWSEQAYYLSNQALHHGKQTHRFYTFFERVLNSNIQSGVYSTEKLYNQRGVIRALLNKSKQAKTDFDKALSINPEYQAPKTNLKALQSRLKGKRKTFQWK